MSRLLPRLLRGLVYVAATSVILLALLVGLVRLLLPLVPEYREEVGRVVAQATGLDVEFQRLSASWPLRGPELSLFDVQLMDPDSGLEVIAAQEVSVGLSVLRLFGEGALVPSRLAVTGAAIEVERAVDGWLLQGRPIAEWLPASETPARVPEIDLVLESVSVRYRDASVDNGLVTARLSDLELQLEDQEVALDGRLVMTGGLPGRLDFSARVDGELLRVDRRFEDADWTASLDAQGLDLQALLNLVLRSETPLLAAAGDIEINARLRGLTPRDLTAEFDLESLQLSTGNAGTAIYPRVAGQLEWGEAPDGWVLSARDLRIVRADSMWPRSELQLNLRRAGDNRQSLTASASFLRLQDIYPLVLAVATPEARQAVLAEDLRGDLQAIELELQTGGDLPTRYSLSVTAERLGIVGAPGGITADGISGSVVADQDGGRLELTTTDAQFRLPDVFVDQLQADELSGFLIWRVTAEGVRVLSDSFEIRAPDLVASSRFEVSLPSSGDSAYLDLSAQASAPGTRALAFLPIGKLPPPVGRWLSRSIVAGRIKDAEVRFDGKLRDWPYDRGEGIFRADLDLENVTVDYAEGWPPARDLSGNLIFDGVSLSSDRNTGNVAGLPINNARVMIPDLRKGLLNIRADQRVELGQTLDLLRALPVSRGLGPIMARLKGSGPLQADLDLRVPVLRPADYRLRIDAEASDAELALDGIDYGFSAINGKVRVRNARLDADDLRAELLGEAVQIQLRSVAPGSAAYGHYALVEGAIPATRWVEVLKLPYSERLSGAPRMAAMALVPAAGSGQDFHVLLRSDLAAMSSSLPAPLAKPDGELAALQVDVGFPATGVVTVDGNLNRDLYWDMQLSTATESWRLDRGAFRFGGQPASLPTQPGLEIRGRLKSFPMDDWLDLGGGAANTAGSGDIYREVAVAVDELTAFGQVFRGMEILAGRNGDGWQVDVDGERAQGRISLPGTPSQEQPVRLAMQRLWLVEPVVSERKDDALSDPRQLPPLDADIDDFQIADLRFGELAIEVDPVDDGVIVSNIDIDGRSFVISGDADWRVIGGDPQRQRSSLRLKLRSADIADTLARLGYGPAIDAPEGTASGELSWPGPPSADFLGLASGGFRFEIQRGTITQLDPGGGRLLGVLSVSALPRRLSLDFSDLVDEGLGFDVLKGDFDLEAGNAYTCNLGLEGSVADLGVVGRTGLRDRDYDQLAVVRPHVSSVLALGSAVVAGPVVGASMLLISQIFRKPLSQLGETYYEVTGPWENSVVKRVQRSQVDTNRFKDCERYLAEVLPESPDQAELSAEPGSELPAGMVP